MVSTLFTHKNGPVMRPSLQNQIGMLFAECLQYVGVDSTSMWCTMHPHFLEPKL